MLASGLAALTYPHSACELGTSRLPHSAHELGTGLCRAILCPCQLLCVIHGKKDARDLEGWSRKGFPLSKAVFLSPASMVIL